MGLISVLLLAPQAQNTYELQTHWNHQQPLHGIRNRTVLGSRKVPTAVGKVVRIPRIGGLINHNERAA